MKRINKKKQLIYTYIEENIKEIIIISLIFIIGVVFGILLINNVKDEGKKEIITYVNTFISNIKQGNSIDKFNIVKTDIKKDVFNRINFVDSRFNSCRNTSSLWNYWI